MENPKTENIYESERLVVMYVKYLTQEHITNIRKIMKDWTPNTSYERNRIVYNKQLKQFYDLEIHDKIACIYTYEPSVIIPEEYINDIIDFLTISIKKICNTHMDANRCGFTLRVYKKNNKGHHNHSILGKKFPYQMEETIYPFQFDSDFNRLKLRNVADICINPGLNNNIVSPMFGASNSSNKGFGSGTFNTDIFGTSNLSSKSFGSGTFGTDIFGTSNLSNNDFGSGTFSTDIFGTSNSSNKGFWNR